MITDAQWLQFLRDKTQPKVLLYEQDYGYESGGAPAVGTLYFSHNALRGAFRTGPTDVPANRVYRDGISSAPKFSRSLDVKTLGGRSESSLGDVSLKNGDRAFDSLLDRILDGYEARFFLGGQTWSRADFRLVLVAVAKRVVAPSGEQELVVELDDKRLLLDVGVAGSVITDVNSRDIGKFKPIPLGRGIHNMEPRSKDFSTVEYYVASSPVAGMRVRAVRDGGVNLTALAFSADNAALTANAFSDTMTRTGHNLSIDDVITFEDGLEFTPAASIFAGLTGGVQYWVISAGFTANDFRVSLTKGGSAVNITGSTFSGTVFVRRRRFYDNVSNDGTIRLSSTPTGRVTLDLDCGASNECKLLDLITLFGGLPSSSIDYAAFSALETAIAIKGASAYSLRLNGIVVYDRKPLRELLDYEALSFYSWYGQDHLGVISAGIIDPPTIAGATANRTLTDIIGSMSCENIQPSVSSFSVLLSKNWVEQTDGISGDAVAIYGRSHQTQGNSTDPVGTTYAGNWQGFHKSVLKGEPLDTMASIGWDASTNFPQGMADAFLADRKPHLRVHKVKTGLEAYNWKFGDTVRVTYPRYGFASGANARVIGIAVDFDSQEVELTLLRQVTPDIAAAA